jgi:hypothetical protein
LAEKTRQPPAAKQLNNSSGLVFCMLEDLAQRMRAVKAAFEQGNVIELRMQGTKAINEASFSSDRLLAEISLIAYSLHKMSIKTHITRNNKWPRIKAGILKSMEQAIFALENKDTKGFEEELSEMSSRLIETDRELGNYAANIYETARVKMASNAYGLGLSLSQAAELTGADKKRLLNYIGITKMHDETIEAVGIAARLKKLEKAIGE